METELCLVSIYYIGRLPAIGLLLLAFESTSFFIYLQLMAKTKGIDAAAMYSSILGDVRNGVFSPVYLLMGEEAYYPDKACEAVMSYALSDEERDFNQSVLYGLDTDAFSVISEARSYPMMSERRLVVLKEAQKLKNLDDLAIYCAEPIDTTVLVILMHGASADKRKALYKSVQKCGVVLESPLLRDYEMPGWISAYFKSRGLRISPDGAALLAEYAGTDLSKIVMETDKMLKNLPEGATDITADHISKNVGISRQFSIFELTKALSYKDAPKALRIASHLGEQSKFAMPMATAMLFTHFYRILKYEALLQKNPRPDVSDKTKVLSVVPFFFAEYDNAVRNYPLSKCMRIISLLEEYDYRGKGGDGAETVDGQLLVELVAKIVNI